MTILIARHGESVNNLPDPSGYMLDPKLTALGLAQARLLGERCAGLHIDALIASPLLRALQTANEISVRRNNQPVRVLHELVEIGTDYATLTHARALEICPAAMPYEAAPGAGDYGDAYALEIRDPYYSLARAYRVVSLVRQSYPEGSAVLLVGHGAFNQRLIAAALRASFPPDFLFSQDNTGVSAIDYRPGEDGREVTRLVMMNDTSHLYGAKRSL
ncbi:MAG: histidine phosphatase family protein [Oscillospiraceae bacterium]|jgi:broad specificity phosphatase PhoE|nr:histidine phosphatase family protein [Oscillospiraceae bacterium]